MDGLSSDTNDQPFTISGLSNSSYTIISNSHVDYRSQDWPTKPCCWCFMQDSEDKQKLEWMSWWGWISWSVTRRWSLDRSLVLFCSIMLCSGFLKMIWMNKCTTLYMMYICFGVVIWGMRSKTHYQSSFACYHYTPCTLMKHCCIKGRKILSRHLKDLRRYKRT